MILLLSWLWLTRLLTAAQDKVEDSETCHYTSWTAWSDCMRKDCTGEGIQDRARTIVDIDTSSCARMSFPSLAQKRSCKTRGCCLQEGKVAEVGARRRVKIGENQKIQSSYWSDHHTSHIDQIITLVYFRLSRFTAKIRSDKEGNQQIGGSQQMEWITGEEGETAVVECVGRSAGSPRLELTACVDPSGRRSEAGSVWLNAEGFFVQCQIRRPCLWPATDCLSTVTVACEDDKGNKVSITIE